MKNFSDLLATESQANLEIKIMSAHGLVQIRWPLLTNIDLACSDPTSVCVEGMQVLDFGYQHDGLWRITLHEPFYNWRHKVTGQGWLLEPQKTAG